jgi:hypothetical protein
MAGLARSAGVAAILGLGTPAIFGQTPGTAKSEKTVKGAEQSEKSAQNTRPVRLLLRIAGLGADGCDVAIKPANPTCRFKPIKKHVNPSGELAVEIKDMEVRGVNRNCSFSITVNEPAQKPRTILRGFRLDAKPADQAPTIQTFACFLSSPSKLARIEEGSKVRK